MFQTSFVNPESVESILDVRETKSGENEYLIDWKKTWIPRSQLKDCSLLIEKFLFKRSNSQNDELANQIHFKEVNDENDVTDGLEISKFSIASANAYNSSGRPSVRKRTDQTILQESFSETSPANVFPAKIPECSEKIENSQKFIEEAMKPGKTEVMKRTVDLSKRSFSIDLTMQLKDDKRTELTIAEVSRSPTISAPKTEQQNEKQFEHCKRPLDEVENPITLGPLENNQHAPNNSCGIQLQVLPQQDWYLKDDVKKQLMEFYNKHAKTPNENMKKARHELDIHLKRFEVELRKKELCKKLEFTGSSFEGLKITSDGLEFDVMCILPVKDIELIEIDECPGFVNLGFGRSMPSKILQNFVDETSNVISPKKVVSKYFSEIALIRNDLGKKEKERMELKTSGPAVCLTFKNENNDIWYKADFVPTIGLEVNGETFHYVAKPTSEPTMSEVLINSWRRSTSKEEKELLKSVDRNNECRRKSIQIVKAICKREATLQTLTSFHLKTILFHLVKQNVPLKWGPNDFYERVFDILGFIQQYLEAKYLPQYFIPSMNILHSSSFNETQLSNMLDRVKKLRSSEVKFIRAIKC